MFGLFASYDQETLLQLVAGIALLPGLAGLIAGSQFYGRHRGISVLAARGMTATGLLLPVIALAGWSDLLMLLVMVIHVPVHAAMAGPHHSPGWVRIFLPISMLVSLVLSTGWVIGDLYLTITGLVGLLVCYAGFIWQIPRFLKSVIIRSGLYSIGAMGLTVMGVFALALGDRAGAVILASLAGPVSLFAMRSLALASTHGEGNDQLQRLDKQLQFMSDITSDAVFLLRNGKVEEANRAARQLFALGHTITAPFDIKALIDPLYHEEFARQLSSGKVDNEATLLARPADGRELAVQMFLPWIGNRRDLSLQDLDIIVFRDMGERQAAQQSIVDQMALLRLTLEDNFHAVALFSRDGSSRFMNRLFRQWMEIPLGQYQGDLTLTGLITWLMSAGEEKPFGVDLGALAGEDRLAVFRVLSPPDPVQCRDMADIVVTWLLQQPGRAGEWEDRNGRVVQYGFRLLPDGGLLVNLFDISEIRQHQDQLHQQSLVMHQQERMARLGSLLTGVSHELNNPLTIVLGQAAMLRDMGESEKSRERGEQIYEAAQRCRRIVNGFLDIARRNLPDQESTDLHALVQQVQAIVQPRLKASNVTTELQLDHEEARIQVDADQIQQVVMNLIINAMQALEHYDGLRKITIGSRVSILEDHCLLWVQDSGNGVPEHLRERVFEPFFTTKGAEEGTGIGLSLCRDIITAHKGDLRLEPNAPGRGARFCIELPLAPRESDVMAGNVAGITGGDEDEIGEISQTTERMN